MLQLQAEVEACQAREARAEGRRRLAEESVQDMEQQVGVAGWVAHPMRLSACMTHHWLTARLIHRD